MDSVEEVKKHTWKSNTMGAAESKKYGKENERRNIDVVGSDKKAQKMSRRIKGTQERSGRPDKKAKTEWLETWLTYISCTIPVRLDKIIKKLNF